MFSNFAAPYASLAVSLPSFFLAYGIYKILAIVYNELTSPLRYVPGPPNSSFIHGNIKQLLESVSRKSYCLVEVF